MGINWGSILSKAQACMQSAQMQSKVDNEIDAIVFGLKKTSTPVHSPREAAEKLSSVIDDAIKNSGISENVQDAIPPFMPGSPTKISKNRYMISVSNTQTRRPSLVPEDYGYIDDLMMLYNDGVDHIMGKVIGYWHGQEVCSRTEIPATHFLETAKENFIGNYGAEYGIIDCRFNRN